jgi:hypothetical protein
MDDYEENIDTQVFVMDEDEDRNNHLYEVVEVQSSRKGSSSYGRKKREPYSVTHSRSQQQQQQQQRSSSNTSRSRVNRSLMLSSNDKDMLSSISKSDIIDQSFLPFGEELTDSAREKFEKMEARLSGYCKSIVVSPNWSNNKASQVPSGYTLLVSRSAPIIPDVFPVKFFHATVALRLDDSMKFKDGTPISESHLFGNREKISLQMNTFISETTDYPVKLEYMPKKGILRDTIPEHIESNWEPCLGTSSGSYAGIYTSVVRDVDKYKKSYWLVVQANSPEVSADFYSLMEDRQPTFDINRSIGQVPKREQRWDSFFRSDETKFLINAAERNRLKLLARLSESLNIDAKYSLDHEYNISSSKTRTINGSGRSNADILKPTIETLTNIVLDVPENKSIIFYNATVNPQKTDGIILNENPLLGPVILKGPNSLDERLAFGGPWELAEGDFSGFPISTGRIRNLSSVSNNKFSDSDNHESSINGTSTGGGGGVSLDTEFFLWEGKSKRNLRLSTSLYRKRDINFRNVEKRLGYDHAWGQIELKPLMVKIVKSS